MAKRVFPFYAQMDSMDCGPACLQMVAKYHGKLYPLAVLRNWCHLDREGVSLPALPHMTGTALVITEERSLLTRIFEQFLKLVSPTYPINE